MKEQDKLDKLFSDGLQNIKVNFDHEEVWDKIKKDKKKKRPLWIWLLLGLLSVVVLISTMFLFTNEKTVQRTAESSESDKTYHSEDIKLDTDKSLIVAEGNKANEIQEKSEVSSAKLNQKSDKSSKTAQGRTNTIQSKSINNTINNSFEKPYEESQSDVVTRINSKVSIVQEPLYGKSKRSNEVYDVVPRIKTWPWLPLSSELEVLQYEQDLLSPNFLDDIVMYELDKNINDNPRYSIELFSAVHLPIINYNNTDAIIEDLVNESHQDLIAYSNQINLNYHFNKQINVSIGLEQQQVFQKFYWKDNIVGAENNYVEDALYYELDGNITEVGDTSYVFYTIDRERQSLQKWNYINIPIGLSLQNDWKMINYGLTVQAVLNVYHDFSGFIFDEQYSNTIKQLNNNNYFTQALGLKFGLRPYISIPITNDWTLSGSLDLQWFANRKVLNNHKQQIYLMGLGMAIQRQF